MNYTEKTEDILNILKKYGIKSATVDYILGYKKYHLSTQISKKLVSSKLFSSLLDFYNDFMEYPDKYGTVVSDADAFFKGRGQPFKRDKIGAGDTRWSVEDHGLGYNSKQDEQTTVLKEAMKVVAQNSTSNSKVIDAFAKTYTAQLDSLISNSQDILNRLSGLYLRGEANFVVALHSLARLENKPVASLVHEADKKYNDLWRQSQEQNSFDDGTSDS